jgi:hypothetical protein
MSSSSAGLVVLHAYGLTGARVGAKRLTDVLLGAHWRLLRGFELDGQIGLTAGGTLKLIVEILI